MKIYLLLMTVFFFGSASYAEEKSALEKYKDRIKMISENEFGPGRQVINKAVELDKLRQLHQSYFQIHKDLMAKKEKAYQSIVWHQEELKKTQEAFQKTRPLPLSKVNELSTKEEAITARLSALGEESLELTVNAEKIANYLEQISNKIESQKENVTSMAQEAPRVIAQDSARALYRDMKKDYYDSKFLLTDIRTLQNTHGLSELQLTALKAENAAHLEKTLLGNYLDSKIKEEYRSPEFCSIINSDRCQQEKRDPLIPLEKVTN